MRLVIIDIFLTRGPGLYNNLSWTPVQHWEWRLVSCDQGLRGRVKTNEQQIFKLLPKIFHLRQRGIEPGPTNNKHYKALLYSVRASSRPMSLMLFWSSLVTFMASPASIGVSDSWQWHRVIIRQHIIMPHLYSQLWQGGGYAEVLGQLGAAIGQYRDPRPPGADQEGEHHRGQLARQRGQHDGDMRGHWPVQLRGLGQLPSVAEDVGQHQAVGETVRNLECGG